MPVVSFVRPLPIIPYWNCPSLLPFPLPCSHPNPPLRFRSPLLDDVIEWEPPLLLIKREWVSLCFHRTFSILSNLLSLWTNVYIAHFYNYFLFFLGLNNLRLLILSSSFTRLSMLAHLSLFSLIFCCFEALINCYQLTILLIKPNERRRNIKKMTTRGLFAA